MSTVKVKTAPVKVTAVPVTFVNFYRRRLPQSSKLSQEGTYWAGRGGGGGLGFTPENLKRLLTI